MNFIFKLAGKSAVTIYSELHPTLTSQFLIAQSIEKVSNFPVWVDYVWGWGPLEEGVALYINEQFRAEGVDPEADVKYIQDVYFGDTEDPKLMLMIGGCKRLEEYDYAGTFSMHRDNVYTGSPNGDILITDNVDFVSLNYKNIINVVKTKEHADLILTETEDGNLSLSEKSAPNFCILINKNTLRVI